MLEKLTQPSTDVDEAKIQEIRAAVGKLTDTEIQEKINWYRKSKERGEPPMGENHVELLALATQRLKRMESKEGYNPKVNSQK